MVRVPFRVAALFVILLLLKSGWVTAADSIHLPGRIVAIVQASPPDVGVSLAADAAETDAQQSEESDSDQPSELGDTLPGEELRLAFRLWHTVAPHTQAVSVQNSREPQCSIFRPPKG